MRALLPYDRRPFSEIIGTPPRRPCTGETQAAGKVSQTATERGQSATFTRVFSMTAKITSPGKTARLSKGE
jgi:hypothetical protein